MACVARAMCVREALVMRHARIQRTVRSNISTPLGLGHDRLQIENNACLPALSRVFYGDLMIGHGFDFRVNRMACTVQRLPLCNGCERRWFQDGKSAGTTQKALCIVEV